MSRQRRKPAGQLRTYGLLVGSVHQGHIDAHSHSPHYEIWVKADTDYRIAVNVQSDDGSEVIAYFEPNFTLPTKLDLPTLAAGAKGFTPLKTGPDGQGLDYLRDKLFALSAMVPIPDEGTGVTLKNLLDAHIKRAIADHGAVLLATGEFFQDNKPDPTFHFTPGRGIHDIHMMQGNGRDFADDNRVNGDGALFIRYGDGETIALFTRFKTQSTDTNNQTGAPN